MSESFLAKRTINGALMPLDDSGREAMRYVGDAIVMVTVSRKRSINRHRWFFALVNLIFENQSHYKTRDELLTVLKIRLGHCDVVVDHTTGEVIRTPKSIAFHNMDETAFAAFCDRTVQLVCEEFIPKLPEGDLRRELADIVGIAEPRAA